MRKFRSIILIVLLIISFSSYSSIVFAGDALPEKEGAPIPTVLPETQKTVLDCQSLMSAVRLNAAKNSDFEKMKELFSSRNEGSIEGYTGNIKYTDILGCGIKTGDIMMWMVPFYIRYLLEFVIGIAGLVAVGGIVYGGYLYLFAGLSDDKEKGKNAIKNGIIGLVLTLVAWAIVNIVIAAVTI